MDEMLVRGKKMPIIRANKTKNFSLKLSLKRTSKKKIEKSLDVPKSPSEPLSKDSWVES